MSKNKVLVIGIDGGTFDLVEPWIREGELPTFKRLMNNGAYGVLLSTPFPHTGPAWVSSITGVNPGKHGIFGFSWRDDQNNYNVEMVNSTKIKSKTLPEILNEYGLRNIMLNVPVTYPPKKINGIIISGMLTPGTDSQFTYPPEIRNEILDKFPGYEIEVPIHKLNKETTDGKIELAREYVKSVEGRISVANYLMRKYEWDFFMLVFSETDRIQHYFWADMEGNHPILKDAVFDVYKKVDEGISKLMDLVSNDFTVFIISDHGFGPYKRTIYLNQWLYESGYLELDLSVYEKLKLRLRKWERLYSFLRKIKGKLLPRTFNSDAEWREAYTKRKTQSGRIKWSKTRAFSDEYGIRFNVMGREPEGIVSPDEVEELKKELIKKLKILGYSDNGEKVFCDVKPSEEVYSGEYLSKAPDIITLMDIGAPLQEVPTDDLFYFGGSTTGSHHKDGVFIASGELVNKRKVKNASIMDITPTILRLFGIPSKVYMDGGVLKIFDEKKLPPLHKKEVLSKHEIEEMRIKNIIRKIKI